MGWIIKLELKTYPDIVWYVKSIKRDLSFHTTTSKADAKIYSQERFFSKLVSSFEKNGVTYEVIEVGAE